MFTSSPSERTLQLAQFEELAPTKEEKYQLSMKEN